MGSKLTEAFARKDRPYSHLWQVNIRHKADNDEEMEADMSLLFKFLKGMIDNGLKKIINRLGNVNLYTSKSFVTTAGAGPQTVPLPGVKAGMRCHPSMGSAGATVHCFAAVCKKDAIDFYYSADPGTTHTVNYFICR